MIETVVANNVLGGELWLCAIAKGCVEWRIFKAKGTCSTQAGCVNADRWRNRAKVRLNQDNKRTNIKTEKSSSRMS